jgi:hypothetical protein
LAFPFFPESSRKLLPSLLVQSVVGNFEASVVKEFNALGIAMKGKESLWGNQKQQEDSTDQVLVRQTELALAELKFIQPQRREENENTQSKQQQKQKIPENTSTRLRQATFVEPKAGLQRPGAKPFVNITGRSRGS